MRTMRDKHSRHISQSIPWIVIKIPTKDRKEKDCSPLGMTRGDLLE
jgi:hypothetical protein